MHAALAAILAEPERWIGGTLVNYFRTPHWPRDRDGSKLSFAEAGFTTTRITGIQLEDDIYFTIIGERFACNGPIERLTVTESPRFPSSKPGELALAGEALHEWHLIPQEGA